MRDARYRSIGVQLAPVFALLPARFKLLICTCHMRIGIQLGKYYCSLTELIDLRFCQPIFFDRLIYFVNNGSWKREHIQSVSTARSAMRRRRTRRRVAIIVCTAF